MKRKNKGERVVRRTLADGSVKEYRYGPRAAATASRVETVDDALRDWQRSAEWRALRPRTVDNYIRYGHPLHEAIGEIPLKEVKRRHLLEIRDEIAEHQGNGAATVFTRTASAFFTWCVDRERVEASPATRLGKGIEGGTLPVWTEDQFATALRLLPEQYRRVVLLAAHTGQRRGDLCGLTWAAWDGRRLTVAQEKSRRRVQVSIPLLPEMAAELERWKAEGRGDHILLTGAGRPWLPESLTKMLPMELKKVGLPPGLNVHGLRKLALVRLAMAGCTPHELMSISGHATLAMVDHYTKGVRQVHLAEQAMNRLSKTQNTENGGKLL